MPNRARDCGYGYGAPKPTRRALGSPISMYEICAAGSRTRRPFTSSNTSVVPFVVASVSAFCKSSADFSISRVISRGLCCTPILISNVDLRDWSDLVWFERRGAFAVLVRGFRAAVFFASVIVGSAYAFFPRSLNSWVASEWRGNPEIPRQPMRDTNSAARSRSMRSLPRSHRLALN